jgi:murein DD-endopeptidase MepM/ murein hydrolase activator NlpD
MNAEGKPQRERTSTRILIERKLDSVAATRACPTCRKPVEVRSRHVLISGTTAHAFCSADCLRAAAGDGEDVGLYPAPPRKRARRLYVGSVVFIGLMMVRDQPRESDPHPAAGGIALASTPRGAAAGVKGALRFGPAWPPTDADWMSEIAQDAWIHPLDGPTRRMPFNDARTFGAERPGERPIECRSGHCGVDIGGEVWGEPVHVVHDGVVDRVQRGPNDDHGGLYVRVAHRGGTVFTQYFHLAAIPRRVVVGLPVKIGEVIGLLGDSGVKHSTAHLHFTISVKPSKELPEHYIDPEPLIALWPLRLPVQGDTNAMAVNAQAAPGVTRGQSGLPKRIWAAARKALGGKSAAAPAAGAAKPAASPPAGKPTASPPAEAAAPAEEDDPAGVE